MRQLLPYVATVSRRIGLEHGGRQGHVVGHAARHAGQVGFVAAEFSAQVHQHLRARGQADIQHQGIQARIGQVTFGFQKRYRDRHGGLRGSIFALSACSRHH